MYIECISNGDCENTLTLGKKYMVYGVSETGYNFHNDQGELIWMGRSQFKMIWT